MPVSPTATDNSVQVVGLSLTGPVEGDGTLATVTFEVIEVKASAIGLETNIANSAAQPITGVTVEGGMVTVSAPTEPEPTEPEPTEPEPTEPEMPEMPEAVEFKITLTNLTMGIPTQGGQIFSPPIFVTHGHGFSIGASGEAASAELTALAETGNNGPLAALAMGSDAVGSVVAFLLPLKGWCSPVRPLQRWSVLVLIWDTSRWRRCL